MSELPPLPLDLLKEVERIEEYATERLSPTLSATNVPKVIRILTSCASEVFEKQAAHYVSLDGCCERWIELIEFQVRQVMVGFAIAAYIGPQQDNVDQAIRRALEDRVKDWKTQVGKIGPSADRLPATAIKTKRQRREPNSELLKNIETVNRKQAAVALGVAERTLDRMVADKRLHPIGAFRSKRFKTNELLRFLKQKN